MGKPSATVPEFLALGVKVLPDFIKDPADLRAAQLSLAESMFENSDYPDAQAAFVTVVESAKAARDIPIEAEAEGYAGITAYYLGHPEAGQTFAQHSLDLSRRRGVTPSARVLIKVFYAENLENAGYRSEANLRLLREAVAESRSEHLPDGELAYATDSLAEDLAERGKLDEAEALSNETLAIYQREPYAVCDQADASQDLAFIRNQRKDYAASLVQYQQAYREFVRCAGADSRNALVSQAFVTAAMLKTGQARAAIPILVDALPKWRKVYGEQSSDIAQPLLRLTMAYLAVDEFYHAERTAETLLQVAKGHFNPLSSQNAVCEKAMAAALAGQHRYADALVHAELADKAFAAEKSTSPGVLLKAAELQSLLLDLRSKLAQPTAGAAASSRPAK